MLEHFFTELESCTDEEKLAFISAEDSLSYKYLIKLLNIASQYLLKNNFANSLTAIILPNTISTCTIILACLKAKITFVSIDVNAPPNEIKKIISQLKPTHLICNDALSSRGLSAGSKTNFLDELSIPIITSEMIFGGEGTANHYQTLYPDNDESFITLTSGSTGIVKGVVHTNFSLCEAITHVLVSLKLEASHRLLITISHPSNAFLRNMLACLIRKATFILGFNRDFSDVSKLIDTYAPTHVRFSIRDLIAFSKISALQHPNIQYIQRCDYSGDVVPKEVIQNVNSLLTNGMLITSYAMSECGTIAINTATKHRDRQQLTGKVIESVDYRLVDEKNNPVGINMIGELQIKTTTLFKKYLHDELETQKVFVEGWFNTGDLFLQQADEFLIFQGRRKNIIIKDGKNINPEYVRQVIIEWPEIEDCIVFGESSSITLQEPAAFCSLKNFALDISHFTKYMKENLNLVWLPRNIYIVDDLPRTVFGKVDMGYLRRNKIELMQTARHVVIE